MVGRALDSVYMDLGAEQRGMFLSSRGVREDCAELLQGRSKALGNLAIARPNPSRCSWRGVLPYRIRKLDSVGPFKGAVCCTVHPCLRPCSP